MNGRQAKALRGIVYGDQSLRQPRKYTIDRNTKAKRRNWGTIENAPDSLRAKYQQAKKTYYQNKSGRL